MRVVLALATSSGQISGVQRHAINVARCLLSRSEVTDLHLLVTPSQHGFVRDSTSLEDERLHLHIVQVGDSAFRRNLWYFAQLPGLAAFYQADIVHLAYPMPLRRSAFHCPTVVTLHDMYPFDIPENFGSPRVLANQVVLRQCLQSVDSIACVSESTRTGLERRMPELARRKAITIHNCVEPISAHRPVQQLNNVPFLLCVAQHRRNKNILLLLQVFRDLLRGGHLAPRTQLVIVGMEGPETKAILRFISSNQLGHRVLLLSGIPDAELRWCYQNCELLLAPSIIEGFGLPVAEAALSGCRVVCSDIPAFREVGGDHCHYVPLDSAAEQGFVDAVCHSLGEPPRKPIAAPRFSSDVIGEKYLELYRSLTLPARRVDRRVLGTSISSPEREHIL
jgi:glycosyltransferase involved in cell wall biosynthesis